MHEIQIQLRTLDNVQNLVNALSKFDNDFDLVSGRYIIDAKSFMGILSLDLNKPVTLCAYAKDEELPAIMEALAPYLYKEG